MPYEGGNRIKLMNLIGNAMKAKLKFNSVEYQLPIAPPSLADRGIEAFVALQPETIAGVTASEVDSQFRLAVILFMRAQENIDLWKCEIIDTAHETLLSLQTNADFTDAKASTIDVDTIDPGPMALASYGLPDTVVVPPSGVLRFDVRILLTYQAFT